MNSLRQNEPILSAFSKNWGWFVVWGAVLVILGMLAISYSVFTSLLSVVILGFLLFISGVVILVDTFTFWLRKGSGFFLHLLMGILYLVAGVVLLSNPVSGSISLTLMFAILYLLVGIFRVIYSLSVRAPKWGWSLFSGILAILIGVLVLSEWPVSGLFIIGLFVGIDLIVSGWTYVMAGLAARSLVK